MNNDLDNEDLKNLDDLDNSSTEIDDEIIDTPTEIPADIPMTIPEIAPIEPISENSQADTPQSFNPYNEIQAIEPVKKLKKEKKPKGAFFKKVGRFFKTLLLIVLLMLGTSAGTIIILDYNGFISTKTVITDTPKEEVQYDGPSLDIIDKGQSDTTVPTETGVYLTAPQVNAKVSPSVVVIESNALGGVSGTGTGIIMSDDGYIITNSHVISGGDIFTVYLHDGTGFKAELIGEDEETDLAIIKIDPYGYELSPAEFGDSTSVVVGDLAYAIGTPGGIELQSTFTGGYISAISREIFIDNKTMTLIQTDAAINPGNSGGPLINSYGQVIGINTIKIVDEEYEGLGFAIPINEAVPILQEILMYGYVTGRPAIGISGRNISEFESKENDIPQGLYVDSVDIRSDAYIQGLKSGDIIYGVNGIETKSSTEINEVRNDYVAGDEITLNIYRAGKKFDITIKLMDEYDLQGTITQQVTDAYSTEEEETDVWDFFNPFSGFFPFD